MNPLTHITETLSFLLLALGVGITTASLTVIRGPGILAFALTYMLGFTIEFFAKRSDR